MKLVMKFFLGMALEGAESSSFLVEKSSFLSWGEQDTFSTSPNQDKADAAAKEIAAWMPASNRQRRVDIEFEHRHIRGHHGAVWSHSQPEQVADVTAPVVEWLRDSPHPSRPSAPQPNSKGIVGTHPETVPTQSKQAPVVKAKLKAMVPVPPAAASNEGRNSSESIRQKQPARGNASSPAAQSSSANTASDAARGLSVGALADTAKEAPPVSPPGGLTHFGGAADVGSDLRLGTTSGTAANATVTAATRQAKAVHTASPLSVANTSSTASRAPTSRSLAPQTAGSGGARKGKAPADEASSHPSALFHAIFRGSPFDESQEKNATPALMTAHSKALECVCGGTFKEGDRVKFTGHSYPPGRTFGTVLGGTVNGFLNVDWDHWSTGHTGNCKLTVCGSCAVSSVMSRWFTSCDQLTLEATESMKPKVVPAAAAAAP